MINAPLYQHLISPAAVGKLKAIINQPYTPNTVFRLKKDDLASYFANVSKAYHSGKGDDFESVAVVFGNPALPISLSDAGLVSDRAGVASTYDDEGKAITMTRNPELWSSMKKYGGHYITVNLDTTTVNMPAKLASGGKGKSRVQIDYLIIVPPSGNTPYYKIFILELKAGKGHLIMDEMEEQQMAKADFVFKHWLGKNTQVELLYHPFLSDDVSFAEGLAAKHASTRVTYLTLRGVCQLLNLNQKLVENIGGQRANYRGNMGTFEGHLSKYMRNVQSNERKRLETAAATETIEDELEKVLMKTNLLVKSAPNVLLSRGTNIGTVFSGKLTLPLGESDVTWKPAVQQIVYLLLKKQELQNKLKTNANTKEIITEMMRITQSILKIDENLRGRILKQNARNSLAKFVANTKNVFSNALNAGSDIHEEYILNYIELRAKMLGRDTTNLKIVNSVSKKRLPTPTEITAGSKTMNVAFAAAKKSGNINFLARMQQLKNFRNLNAASRGSRLKVISNALKSKYNPNITNLRYKINNAKTIQNLNSVKTNLNTQDSKLEQIYRFLMSNMPVGTGYNGVTPNSQKYSLSTLYALRSRIEEAQVDIAAKSARMRGHLAPQQVRQANEMANAVFQPPNNTGAGNMFAESPALQRAPSLKRQRQAPPPTTRSRRLRS
jgi:hypothetical protein